VRRSLAYTLLALTLPSAAAAQNYDFDSRGVALGGFTGRENVARQIVDDERNYRRIVIPLGLMQVLAKPAVFNPDSEDFDPVRGLEYVASPLHYTFGRDESPAQQRFVTDIVNARFSRDLNTYDGFTPAAALVAEGLAFTTWGKTFALRETGNGFHGIYVGAGPYLALRNDSRFDPRLVAVTSAPTVDYVPNTSFSIGSSTSDQVAVAVAGGYRARLPIPAGLSTGSTRDGLYVAAHYDYLVGLHYDDIALRTTFDTDAAGLVTLHPLTSPVGIDRVSSSHGRGFSLDFGGVLVVDRWDIGLGVSGVANRITWRDLDRQGWALGSLFNGGEFVEIEQPAPQETRRVTLPTVVSTDVTYHADGWSASGEYVHGFQGHTLRAGYERRLRRLELRAGGRYSAERWQPSAGIGVDITERFGIDAAVFGTSTNIERQRRAALAISLRFAGGQR
jgi:hypothetical protein